MFVTALQLTDFRSYADVTVALGPGVTVFVGSNGQGKTNLVEAVDYLATLGSHRVASEAPLVRAGASRAVVRARVAAGLEDRREILLEIELTPGKANKARLNRSPLPRARDLLGMLRTVVFSPEDLAIVKGDPAERRRFIDELVTARWPRMAGVRQDYERVLRQRNQLLKSMAGRSRFGAGGDADSTLAVWNEQLARFGAELLAARLDTLRELAPLCAQAYAEIAPTNNVATVAYKSSLDRAARRGSAQSGDDVVDVNPSDSLAAKENSPADSLRLEQALLEAMESRRGEEVARGVSLVGPHRDDLMLGLGALPARGYASHGESWSFALALRLGAFHLLRADGIEPVLVLDDVFAELDATRRQRLAAMVSQAEQVLVTAAVAEDVPAGLDGALFRVVLGAVLRDDANAGQGREVLSTEPAAPRKEQNHSFEEQGQQDAAAAKEQTDD